MAVYTRKNRNGEDVWFCDFMWVRPDGTKKRIRKPARDTQRRPCQSKTAAEAFEQRLRSQLLLGSGDLLTPVPPPPEPVKTALGDFWERYTKDHIARKKPSTQQAAKVLYRQYISPALGHLSIAEIHDAEIATLVSYMRNKDVGPKTINNALSCLRTCLTTAVEWKVREAPVPKIKWEKGAEKEIEFFTSEEIERLVNVYDPMVTVALKTGLRSGELLALKWSDIKDGKITVQRSVWWHDGVPHDGATKTNRIRVVPLPKSAQEALDSLGRLSEFVFCDNDGNRLTKAGIKNRLWHACTAAGLDKCGWHKLRHSYISELVRLNVPLPQVQKLAGHSKLDMTMRYVHIHAEDLVSAVNRLK